MISLPEDVWVDLDVPPPYEVKARGMGRHKQLFNQADRIGHTHPRYPHEAVVPTFRYIGHHEFGYEQYIRRTARKKGEP